MQSMLRLKHDGHKFWPLPGRRLRMLPVIQHYQVQKLAAFLAYWSKNSARPLPQIGTWVEERGSTFRPKGVLSFACSHLWPSKEGACNVTIELLASGRNGVGPYWRRRTCPCQRWITRRRGCTARGSASLRRVRWQTWGPQTAFTAGHTTDDARLSLPWRKA
jgi:hypothetical protein